MRLLALVVFLIASNGIGETADFERICRKASRPAGFDTLVEVNLAPDRPGAKPGTVEGCRKLAGAAAEVTVVSVFDPLQPLSLVSLFPKMERLTLSMSARIDSLELGSSSALRTVSVSGDLRLEDLGDLLSLRDLRTLNLVGKPGGGSFVDLKGISRLKRLDTLLLKDLDVRHAREIEKLGELVSFTAERARMDGPVSFSSLPKLKIKRVN